MTKEEKAKYVDELANDLANNSVIYLADTAELTVEAINSLRRKAFNAKVSMRVVKNTLLEKAMERVEDKDFGDLKDTLKGATSMEPTVNSLSPQLSIRLQSLWTRISYTGLTSS